MSESADHSDPIARLRAELHPSAFVDSKRLRGYGVGGRRPQCVVFPVNPEAVSRCLANVADLGLAAIPTGIGARMRIGAPPARYDVSLCTRDLDRIVAHEAADMTVTVGAGCPLTTLNGTLARCGQWVPIDPPLPERTSVGGLIATDASGPLRFSQGKVRDLLIGITVVLADGRLVRGGGRVVKNVAGYDLMKLFTGSWGTLGVIVEATFKVRPRPAQTSVIVIETHDPSAAAQAALEVMAAQLAPLYVEVVNGAAASAVGVGSESSFLLVGLGGTAEEVAVQRERLIALAAARPWQEAERGETARLYTALRDWPALSAAHASMCGATISVLPSQLATLLLRLEETDDTRSGIALLAHAGNGAVCVRSSSRGDKAADLAWFDAVRDCARSLGGFATFDAVPPPLVGEVDVWGPQLPGIGLMRGIKAALDPQARLSPGRFVGGI